MALPPTSATALLMRHRTDVCKQELGWHIPIALFVSALMLRGLRAPHRTQARCARQRRPHPLPPKAPVSQRRQQRTSPPTAGRQCARGCCFPRGICHRAKLATLPRHTQNLAPSQLVLTSADQKTRLPDRRSTRTDRFLTPNKRTLPLSQCTRSPSARRPVKRTPRGNNASLLCSSCRKLFEDVASLSADLGTLNVQQRPDQRPPPWQRRVDPEGPSEDSDPRLGAQRPVGVRPKCEKRICATTRKKQVKCVHTTCACCENSG